MKTIWKYKIDDRIEQINLVNDNMKEDQNYMRVVDEVIYI